MSTDIKAHSPWTTTHKSRQTISVSSENTPNPIRLNCRCSCLRRLSPSEHSSPERCSCFSIRGFRLGQTSHRKPLDITRDYVLPSRDWCRTTERIYATRRLRAANVLAVTASRRRRKRVRNGDKNQRFKVVASFIFWFGLRAGSLFMLLPILGRNNAKCDVFVSHYILGR